MFKRLVVLMLLTIASLAASTPARASTLTVVSVTCFQYGSGYYTSNYRCGADVTGGTGSYVSYTWNITSTQGNYSIVTSEAIIYRPCTHGEYLWPSVTVTDSAGSTASGAADRLYCSSGTIE